MKKHNIVILLLVAGYLALNTGAIDNCLSFINRSVWQFTTCVDTVKGFWSVLL